MTRLHPALMLQAIRALQDAGVTRQEAASLIALRYHDSAAIFEHAHANARAA